jgi:hypothetical protein
MKLDIQMKDIWETTSFGDAEVVGHDPSSRYCWCICVGGFNYTITEEGKVTSGGPSPQDLKTLKRRAKPEDKASAKPWLDSLSYFRECMNPGWYNGDRHG